MVFHVKGKEKRGTTCIIMYVLRIFTLMFISGSLGHNVLRVGVLRHISRPALPTWEVGFELQEGHHTALVELRCSDARGASATFPTTQLLQSPGHPPRLLIL